MGYDVSYSNIKNDIPEDTREIFFEAMKIYYTVRYIMKINRKKISDEFLTIFSLYTAILKTNNRIRKQLNDLGIFYDDLAENYILGIEKATLDDEDYKNIYNKFFHYLTIKIYTYAQWQNESLDFDKFYLEYVFGYLHQPELIHDDEDAVDEILSYTYGEDMYEESQTLAFDILKDLYDKEYYNVPDTNLTVLLSQSVEAMLYYDISKGETVPPALQYTKKKNEDN